MESPPSTIDSNAPRQRELRTLVLNCLSVRSDRQLIAWAVDAFGLPAGKRPYTDYTTDFVCGAIFGHVGDSGASHVVLLRHRWLMSMEVRRIIFGKDGWCERLGYPLAHDYGFCVGFR